MIAAPTAHAGPTVLPAWRRARLWIALAVLVVLGALVVNAFHHSPGGPLDPDSSGHDGTHALATLLGQYGVHVHRSSDLAAAAGAVVVAVPDDYSDDQLAALRSRAALLVLLAPSDDALRAVGAPLATAGHVAGHQDAGCSWPGATAAGALDVPPALAYLGDGRDTVELCYGAAVAVADGLVVLGTDALVTNSHLADDGVAAVAVNAVSADRSVTDLTWLLPGTTAIAAGPATAWALFPDGARRAFVWLIPLGLVLALWRGRRFGPVVSEPLPVVVRAAELVEGHGRLYRRAGARDRAAAALRAGALHRLGLRLGGRLASPDIAEIVDTLARQRGFDAHRTWQALAGPVPTDDAQLLALAVELDTVEAAAAAPSPPEGSSMTYPIQADPHERPAR